MTHEELKEALLSRRPVIWASPYVGDIAYKYVSAIIYRASGKSKITVTAELADECGRSVSIVDPAKIRYREGKK